MKGRGVILSTDRGRALSTIGPPGVKRSNVGYLLQNTTLNIRKGKRRRRCIRVHVPFTSHNLLGTSRSVRSLKV